MLFEFFFWQVIDKGQVYVNIYFELDGVKMLKVFFYDIKFNYIVLQMSLFIVLFVVIESDFGIK